MRLLLASLGITNPSIETALREMLDAPVPESSVLYVPTAMAATPNGTGYAWQMMADAAKLGWGEFGMLELTSLPSTGEEFWLPALEAADVIWLGGGNGLYLSYWLHESGLAARLPRLLEDKVYVGTSAGAMVLTAGLNIDQDHLARTGEFHDDEYAERAPIGAGSDRTLGIVDVVIRPHLNSPWFPFVDMAFMERAAKKVDRPLYAIDDDTALAVTDGDIEVVSEGNWRRFDPPA